MLLGSSMIPLAEDDGSGGSMGDCSIILLYLCF